MKKVLSILIVFAMLLSLPITVFAADGGATPKPVEIKPVNMAFLNGSQFYQYDPAGFFSSGDGATFVCDGEFFTMNPNGKNPVKGTPSEYGVLQYRYAMKGDYDLSYQVKLNESNKDRLYTWFYWQDYTQNGRSYQTSQRGIGFSLKLEANDGNLSLGVMANEKTQGKGSAVAATSGNATSDLLKDVAANALLNVSLKWEKLKLTAKVSLASDASKTTGDVVFDLSNQTDILNAIKEPAGFAFLFAPVEMKVTTSSSVGHMAYTDLTAKDAKPVEIKLVNMAFLNGSQFYQYDPAGFFSNGDGATFVCDGEFFTMNPNGKNPVKGTPSEYGVLQYRYAMKGDYDLSYQVKLNESNKDRLYTWFYWQDYTQNGRSYQTSQRGIGFSLKLEANDGNLSLGVMANEKTQGKGSAVAATSGNATSDLLKDVAANALLNVSLKWEKLKLTAKVSLASDASKTTGDVVFDLSNQTDILNAIKEPAGFAFLFAPSEMKVPTSSSVGHISYTDYASDAPAIDPDYNYLALNHETYATLTEGNKFERGEDNWFTRKTDAVATDNAVIESKKETSYNYTLSFRMKLNADNTGRVGMWNIWDGKYSGSHYGYMLNLTAVAGGQLTYSLARYEGNWSDGKKLVTADTAANAENVKILEGQDPNAELLITVTVKDLTLSVDVALAKDPTKKAGTVTYDLSAGTERAIHRIVNRKQGFAIMDMAGQAKVISASYGDITYTALPGDPPAPEVDNTDYNKILTDETYQWNGDIPVTEDTFSFYTMDGLPQYEKFSIENGWLVRKNENNLTQTDGNAYAMAQYKGVMDPSDYKLTFRVKADADNMLRFSVLTRWDDKDDSSMIKFKNQTGYRIYFYTFVDKDTSEMKLEVFCYRTGGAGRMAPLAATADNLSKLVLTDIEKGKLELEVTLVMKDSLIVAEAHVAGDPTKSTGPVAYDTLDDANLYGQIDRTQGFCLVDSSNEAKCGPASFGEFRIYAAKAPQTGSDSVDTGDPDDNITTDKKPETDKPGTDASTDKTQGDDKGCASGISVIPMVSVLVLSAAAVTVIRKKKED